MVKTINLKDGNAYYYNMIDIKALREHPEIYKENMQKKCREDTELVDEVIKLDKQWRALKVKADNLRKKRNEFSKKINQVKKNKDISAGRSALNDLIVEARQIPIELKAIEEEEENTQEELTNKLKQIPNIMHKDVPKGEDESQNVEKARFGPEPVEKEVRPHQEIAEELDLADFDASARTSGNGFYYVEDQLALLNRALLQFAVDTMVEKGFRYVETPLMLRGDVVSKVVDLRDQEEQIYKIEDEDLYLIGTSEHSLIGRFIDETIEANQLPFKQTSYSMCFRREKGSHGLDEKGFFRTHQFNKIEMVVICRPEESHDFYKQLQDITVDIFTKLELPTRVLQLCSGDLGVMKHDQVDIEVWSPRRSKWIEVGSCSNLTDAQARSLGIRVHEKGEYYLPHTLNNTAMATSRAIVAILENCQNPDGTVNIPKVLHKYMYGMKKIDGKSKK